MSRRPQTQTRSKSVVGLHPGRPPCPPIELGCFSDSGSACRPNTRTQQTPARTCGSARPSWTHPAVARRPRVDPPSAG
eukprot:909734-Alexandrium_andersonii.AAC.1